MQNQPPSPYRFVNVKDLTPEQQQDIQQKWDSLARTVPKLQQPPLMHVWVLLDKDVPVGAFTFVPLAYAGVHTGEVGLRVWMPTRTVLEAGRHWLSWLLQNQAHLIGRVFPSNAPVKKLLQTLGFRLCGYDYDADGRAMDVFMLERGHLMGARPRKHIGDEA